MWSAALLLAALGAAPHPVGPPAPVPIVPVPLAPAPAQKKPKARPIVPFPEDLAAAKREAAERNVPILVLMALEGEEASDRFRKALFPDLTLARACERAVVLFTNNGVHEVGEIVEEVDGREETRRLCKLYKTPSCTIHQRVWDQVFFEFNREGEIRLPHVLVLSPDGKLFERISTSDVPGVDRVVDAVRRAAEKAGHGLTGDELRDLRAELVPARRDSGAKAWADAWRHWRAVAELAITGPYADEARTSIAACEAGLREELAYAVAKLVPGDAARGYELLFELRRDVEGLPLEEEVEERLVAAERDKELRDEIRAFKVELDARAVLDEARAAIAQGEERKAERLVRRLLKNKRFAETQAARNAREEFPQWAED